MTVYNRLQTVAVELQKTELKKSGMNKFAGFKYFELADFLPTVNELFLKNGLAGYCSFTSELASLTIADIETGETIVVTSPMVDIEMKGANAIQALGAVETYSRRYLYLAALGIVENDTVDSKPMDSDSKITAKQVSMIRALASNEDIQTLLEHYSITTLSELPATSANPIIKRLQEKNGKDN
jgi:hypothetical protein